jgi:hypothetical protein
MLRLLETVTEASLKVRLSGSSSDGSRPLTDVSVMKPHSANLWKGRNRHARVGL